jgi:hypothetical protein
MPCLSHCCGLADVQTAEFKLRVGNKRYGESVNFDGYKKLQVLAIRLRLVHNAARLWLTLLVELAMSQRRSDGSGRVVRFSDWLILAFFGRFMVKEQAS